MQNDEFKAAFITAIRTGGAERERAFKFFEEKLGPSFKGPEGFGFYTDLLSIVKEADPDAVKEYQKRFVPLLDQKALGKEMLSAFTEALPAYVAERQKEVLAEGGERAIETFLKYAAEYANDEGNSLRQWIELAIPALPERERYVIVELLIRRVLSAEAAPRRP